MRGVNDKLAPTFRDYGYRGFFASRNPHHQGPQSLRHRSLLPLRRAAATKLMLEIVSNWADIIWHGAEGDDRRADLYAAKWAAELLLISDWADENWLPVQFPASIRDRVKLRYLTKIEGKYYCVPQASHHPEIGAVVGLGDTMEDAIKDVTSSPRR